MTEESLNPPLGAVDQPEQPRAHKLSEILTSIAQTENERISIGDLLAALEHRALAALLFIFAVPNAFPAPPGTSTVLGAPMLFLAAQLALGLKPWLPKIISNRSLKREEFQGLIKAVTPWLAKAEKLLRPRLEGLTGRIGKQVVGVICLLLSIILVLPIWLGNMLPALAICILALGLLERDGYFVLAGFGVSIASVVIVTLVVGGMILAAMLLITNFFG